RALQVFIEHRQTVIVRRSNFELAKARARQHILDGYLIALANLDAVIKTIRESQDADVAKTNLMKRFKLSDLQAQAILDMQLRRLAALERQKIEDEHKQVAEQIAYLEDLLAHPKKILALIQTDLKDLAEKYGDDRRTRIASDAKEELTEADLVQDEAVLISLTERGYVKRVAASAFRIQSRGGRGVKGHETKEEDEVMMLIPARSLDSMLFFSDRGKVYSEKVYQIPDADRAAKGIPLVNVLALDANERVTAAIAVSDFSAHGYCMMATARGKVKRVVMEEFASVRPSGLIAMTLDEGDTLGWARVTSGKDEVIFVTERGQALRFSEDKVRSMGRQAAGVQGIRLGEGDSVTSMDVVDKDGSLLVVTTGGFGKLTPLKEYTPKGRATGGIATIDQKVLPEIGKIAAARVVHNDDELTIITANGVALRLKVKAVKQSGRATKGVHLIKPQDTDYVASVARIAAEDLKRAGAQVSEEEVVEEQPKLAA
ncbi:MAG TPA: DNA gyrase C-terminal beta-propeller domain-containing protein, partial [Anaerolineales bacterium]|nr:DNA gyrase C-terminal beta-propeller domain-containing protein [Anaerolineales bacterium]